MQKQKLTEEINFVESLKMLAHAYEEISVTRMQQIRGNVLKTRYFLTNLSEIFHDVKSSYKNQIINLMKKRKKDVKNITSFSTISKNGRSVTVLISSNTKLYGEIIPKVSNLFMDNISKIDSDIVIVGKFGKDLYEKREIKKPYTYFEIPDTEIAFEDLELLVAFILQYEKVTVYYGKFLNVVSQEAAFSDVSGEESFSENGQEAEKGSFKFIFEPSLETILNFFETQIFTSLFKQTVHESQLARYASRINAMEQALENVEAKEKEFKKEGRRIKSLIFNKKQTEMISEISLLKNRRKNGK